MNFEMMLEYQKYDQELYNRQAALLNSPEGRAKKRAEAEFSAAKEALGKLNDAARGVLGEYAALKTALMENIEELDGFNGILDEVSDPIEMGNYLKRAIALKTALDALDKRMAEAKARMEKISQSFGNVVSQGQKAGAARKAAEAAYNGLVQAQQAEFDALRKKMDAIKENIPEDMAEYFKARASVKKFPVMTSYDPKSKYCRSCGMDIAGDTVSKLKNPGDYAECPNCRRLLYIPK